MPLGEYCYEWLAAMKGKFALREKPRINYAYHFDAALYARYLRKLCEPKGVKRIEGKIKEVRTHADGSVASLELHSGQIIEGDFFIDCTGFRGLLIEGALQDGLRGLEPLAALRQRLRLPDRGRRTGATVHGVLRA